MLKEHETVIDKIIQILNAPDNLYINQTNSETLGFNYQRVVCLALCKTKYGDNIVKPMVIQENGQLGLPDGEYELCFQKE